MKAQKLCHRRQTYRNGLIEMVIWRLPQTDAERPHGLKYRLVYVRNHERLIGYDNERGKGDHKHLAGCEEPYPSSVYASYCEISGPTPGD